MSNRCVPHLHAWFWRFVEVGVVATALSVLALSPAVSLPAELHVDPACQAAIRQGPPTMIFHSPSAAHAPFARTTSWVPTPLPAFGSIVRVAGYQRLAFEGSVLYRAPVAFPWADADSYRLDLYAVWPGEPFWHRRAVVRSAVPSSKARWYHTWLGDTTGSFA